MYKTLLDKKRSRHILNAVQGYNSQETSQDGSFKNSVAQFWANVNWEKLKKQKNFPELTKSVL